MIFFSFVISFFPHPNCGGHFFALSFFFFNYKKKKYSKLYFSFLFFFFFFSIYSCWLPPEIMSRHLAAPIKSCMYINPQKWAFDAVIRLIFPWHWSMSVQFEITFTVFQPVLSSFKFLIFFFLNFFSVD